MDADDMTPYDRAAWHQCLKVLHAPSRHRFVPAKVRDGVAAAASKAVTTVGGLPGAASAQQVVERAFAGTLALTFQPALRSASVDSVVKQYAKRHPHVTSQEDVRALALMHRDAMLPPKFAYTALSAGQGAVTALAVTGAEVATSVTAGTTAGVAVAAIAADSVASMAIMGRTIGAVVTRYGYDVRRPDEELFAMGVLSLGVAGSLSAKTQALSALSRLTQRMMRRATWKQLNEHVLVQAISRVYQLLGVRLTQRKLAQAVPVLGVGLNAALTAQLTEQTFRRAQAVYRLRALSEIYGVDPAEWASSGVEAGPQDDADRYDVVDVVQVLEGARQIDQDR